MNKEYPVSEFSILQSEERRRAEKRNAEQNALRWLTERQRKWNLKRLIDKKQFLKELSLK
jgi:hypothetical protein